MERDRTERVDALFRAASQLSPSDWSAFLDRECGDEFVRSEVLDLLGHGDRAEREDFLGARTWHEEPAEPPPKPLGIPGRYENLREHKRGGMGVVYKAWDVKLGRDVAYKVMSAAFGRDDEFRRKFAREAEITARLQYPGIVPVFGLEEDGSGRPAYTMQFVEGTDFRDLIRDHSIADGGTLRKWLGTFLSACRIVAFAHQQKYVHGDLSPCNLMIAEGGAAFVVDWGLARHVGPAGSDEGIGEPIPGLVEPATPGFAAPSVRAGGPRTFATDVYSLGAVLATLVGGMGGNLEGPGRRAVPRPLRAIIDAAMVDRTGGRYQTAGALADDIGRYLDGEKVCSDAEPWRELVWRSIRHHPTRATATVSSILILSVAMTSAALILAARDRAATSEEKGRRQEQEAKVARQEAVWNQAVAAMLRCDAILSRTASPSLVPPGMIDPFLKALAVVAKEPGLAAEASESIRASRESARQFTANQDAREREAAEPELRQIIATLERLNGEAPDPRNIRFYLAKSYFGLGVLELTRATAKLGLPKFYALTLANLVGRPTNQPEVETALAKIDKSLELIPSGTADPSEQDSIREISSRTWDVRVIILMQLGRFTECLKSLDQALPLARGPAEVAVQKLRPVLLKAAEIEQSHMPWSGKDHPDHVRAVRMADYLVGQSGVSPEAVFNAACAFSLASLDIRAVDEERERRAKRAVVLLAQIEAGGYFRASKKAGELREDYALDPLRARDEFKALAARVAKGG